MDGWVGWWVGERKRERVPLLNFVEAGEERDGDEDDDCFFAVADLELLGFRKELVSCFFFFVFGLKNV